MNGQRPDLVIIDEAVHLSEVRGEVVFYPPTPQDIAHQRVEWRRNAMRASNGVLRLYPGPVGEVLAKEIYSWVDQGGYLFDRKPKLMTDLIAQILGELDA